MMMSRVSEISCLPMEVTVAASGTHGNIPWFVTPQKPYIELHEIL
jgi:hypothetical protein